MTDISSLHSSEVTASDTTNTFSSTSVPLFLKSSYEDENQRNPDNILPKLPSHRFRFSVWHDVEHIDITGDRLRAPRVREGPPQKEALFYRLRDENDKSIHHSLEGTERKRYQSETENWEAAKHVNLSYQELQHDYQKAQLLRVLKRLPSAERVVLINNELVDMSSISLPQCVYLDLTMNHVLNCKALPSLPKIRYLKLAQNAIYTFNGVKRLSGTPIEHLILRENPIAFTPHYRLKIFEMLPNLVTLDGIPKRPQDRVSEHSDNTREDEYLANKDAHCAIL